MHAAKRRKVKGKDMQVKGEAAKAIGRVVELYKACEIPCGRCGALPDKFYSVIIGGDKEDVCPEGCARFHLMAFCRDCISSGELRPFVERLILEDEAGKCDEVAL